MAKTDLPILEQRRIEANVISPIYDEMKRELGEEQAKAILSRAITRASIEQAQAYAQAHDEETSLESFHGLLAQWKANGALEVDMLEETPERVHYNVVHCQYAQMYREMGLAEIGHILSCGRDGSFCTGYDPRIKLERTQTVMEGAPHCDFRYRWEPE